jgi:hypothetical protein
MPPIEQIVVPSAMFPFLVFLFDKVKPWLQSLAPFKQSNPNHATNLRSLFYTVCAVAVLIAALASGLVPHSFDAGVELLERVLVTAGFLTAGGHLVYDQLSGAATAKREAVEAPVEDPELRYPPTYDAGGDLRASAGDQPQA